MPAGLNTRGRVWRLYTPQDDDQGGAVPSGTILYDNIWSRLSPLEPTLALLEQGLETPTIYNGLLGAPPFSVTGAFQVLPNDQYEITWPPISPYLNQKFLILGEQHQSFMSDNGRYMNVKLRRLIIANSNNLQ